MPFVRCRIRNVSRKRFQMLDSNSKHFFIKPGETGEHTISEGAAEAAAKGGAVELEVLEAITEGAVQ